MRIETALLGHDAPRVPAETVGAERQRGRSGTLSGGQWGTDGPGLYPEALVSIPVARATGRILALAASLAALAIAGGAAIRPF